VRLPRWILIWFAISLPLVVWDVAFVLLRPASMPGGGLAFLWAPYAKYITIDRSYGDLGNGFVWAQAIMSCVEVAIAIGALAIRRRPVAVLLIFCVSVLTCAKTILILVIALVTRGADLGGSTSDVILLYLLPNSAWVVMPMLVAWATGRALVSRPGVA
jgi:hypothetical protein